MDGVWNNKMCSRTPFRAPVSFLVHDRLPPPPNTDWAFICFLLVTLRGDMLDSQHLKHPFPSSSRSSNLSAVYSEHDWGCQDLQVAVHRVQVLHPLWDLREWCECGILLGREQVVEPKGLWGRREGRTFLGERSESSPGYLPPGPPGYCPTQHLCSLCLWREVLNRLCLVSHCSRMSM